MYSPSAPLAPPQAFAMPSTAQAIFTFAQIVPVSIGLFIAVRSIRQGRGPVLLFCMLGALLACFLEPTLDLTTNVWLGSPSQGQWVAFSTLGHPFPLWTLGSYTWYVGGEGFLVLSLLTGRGAANPRRTLWLCFGAFVLSDVLLEVPGLGLNVYVYYGPQALRFLRFPLFWAAANSAIPVVLGTALYLLRGRATGIRKLVVIPLVPFVAGGVWGAVLFPVADAQNGTHVPMVAVDLAGIATVLLATLCVWLISQALPAAGEIASPAQLRREVPSAAEVAENRVLEGAAWATGR